jgi:hypothetical protein
VCKEKTLKQNHFSKDVTEFIILLHEHKVKYLLVGGEAVIFYGHARLTGDVDFFYENTETNARALYSALLEFWNNDIPEINGFKELQESGLILQFGLPPNRIDLMNRISGVDFATAWNRKTNVFLCLTNGKVAIHIIGKEDLLDNKRASNRPKDQSDLIYFSGGS